MNKKVLISEAGKIVKNINRLKKKQIKKSILYFGDKVKITIIPEDIKSEIFRILKCCLLCKNIYEKKFFIKIIINKLKFEIPHTASRIY